MYTGTVGNRLQTNNTQITFLAFVGAHRFAPLALHEIPPNHLDKGGWGDRLLHSFEKMVAVCITPKANVPY